MAYSEKSGEGGLWKNQKKSAGDNKPDATGFVVAHRDISAGEKLEIAAWTRVAKESGARYQFLKMGDAYTPKESDKDELDDDIPF